MQFFVLDYIIGNPYETDFLHMEPDFIGDEGPKCPQCGNPLSGLPWLPPYRAIIRGFGRALGDCAFFGAKDLLVSERFRRAWETAQLRGIQFTPLERVRVRPARLGKPSVAYFHVAPRLFGTQIDTSRSHILRREPISCEKCKYGGLTDGIRGFAIDESSWTGEDMFFAWGMPGSIIVTDRVRQLRDEHGLTNMHLIPVEEYYWDPYGRPREQTAHLWNDTT